MNKNIIDEVEYEDLTGWSNLSFIGKVLAIMGIIVLFCLTVILVVITIIVVKLLF